MTIRRACRLFVRPAQAADDWERIEANLTISAWALGVASFNLIGTVLLLIARHIWYG